MCKLICFFHPRSLHVKQKFLLITYTTCFICMCLGVLDFQTCWFVCKFQTFLSAPRLCSKQADDTSMSDTSTPSRITAIPWKPSSQRHQLHFHISRLLSLFAPTHIKEPRIFLRASPNQLAIHPRCHSELGFPALKKNKCSYVPRIILAGLRWYDSKWVSRIICLNPDRRSAEPDSVRAENAYLVLLFRGCYTTSHSPPQFSQGNAFFAIPLNIMPILPCISYSYNSQCFLCTYAFYRNKACLTVHATWRLQRYMTSAIFHLRCLAAGHPCNPGSLAAQRHRFVLCHGSTHHI